METVGFPLRALECEFAFQQMAVRGNFNVVEIFLHVGWYGEIRFLGAYFFVFFWHGFVQLILEKFLAYGNSRLECGGHDNVRDRRGMAN